MNRPASETRPFESIERLLVAWLPGQVGAHVSAESWNKYDAPDDIPGSEIPIILVDRVSGADYLPKLDRPVVDVDVFGRTREEAQDLAEAVRHALRTILPGTTYSGVVFTRTRTLVGPRSLSHGNPNIRRYTAEYEIAYHLTPAA